jgi:hypothetical protein
LDFSLLRLRGLTFIDMAQTGTEVVDRSHDGHTTDEEIPGELEALEAVSECLFGFVNEYCFYFNKYHK